MRSFKFFRVTSSPVKREMSEVIPCNWGEFQADTTSKEYSPSKMRKRGQYLNILQGVHEGGDGFSEKLGVF